jgi:hypothetical protein
LRRRRRTTRLHRKSSVGDGCPPAPRFSSCFAFHRKPLLPPRKNGGNHGPSDGLDEGPGRMGPIRRRQAPPAPWPRPPRSRRYRGHRRPVRRGQGTRRRRRTHPRRPGSPPLGTARLSRAARSPRPLGGGRPRDALPPRRGDPRGPRTDAGLRLDRLAAHSGPLRPPRRARRLARSRPQPLDRRAHLRPATPAAPRRSRPPATTAGRPRARRRPL